jgi:hypothetical protein
MKHESRLIPELSAQDFAQIAVAFDRPDLGSCLEQRCAQGAQARTDLDHAKPRTRLGSPRDGIVHRGGVQEVLPPALLREESMATQ